MGRAAWFVVDVARLGVRFVNALPAVCHAVLQRGNGAFFTHLGQPFELLLGRCRGELCLFLDPVLLPVCPEQFEVGGIVRQNKRDSAFFVIVSLRCSSSRR